MKTITSKLDKPSQQKNERAPREGTRIRVPLVYTLRTERYCTESYRILQRTLVQTGVDPVIAAVVSVCSCKRCLVALEGLVLEAGFSVAVLYHLLLLTCFSTCWVPGTCAKFSIHIITF